MGGVSVYLQHFGLKRDPFCATPDPTTLYLTTSHRDALAGLSYAILAHKGFAVLTGDAGTGKTTVLSRIVQMAPSNQMIFSVIQNSALSSSEFLESVMLDFGLNDIPASKALRLQVLSKFLMSEYTAGRTCVLIIDEAQKLSEETVEEVRLLSNYEMPDQKLLQIILSGQTEFEALLERQALRQFKQRVSVRLRIVPLTSEDFLEYIRFRWMKAGGGDTTPFEREALYAVAEHARGIPRVINILCDNSLLVAFAAGADRITAAHVNEAAADLGLRGAALKPLETPLANAAAVLSTPQQDNAQRAALTTSRVAEPLPTLRRYDRPDGPLPSRLSRWVAKLGRTRQADGTI